MWSNQQESVLCIETEPVVSMHGNLLGYESLSEILHEIKSLGDVC